MHRSEVGVLRWALYASHVESARESSHVCSVWSPVVDVPQAFLDRIRNTLQGYEEVMTVHRLVLHEQELQHDMGIWG